MAAEYGFAVGGGTALIAHGIVDRYTADLDLVSPRERAVEAAAALVEAALRAEGLQVERQDRTDGLVDEWPGWEEEIGGGLGEWVITAPGGEEMVLQMACFDRSRSPVIINTVPVLDVEDAVGWKVHAFLTRVEPRDAYDVAMALGRYSVGQLIGFALRVEPSLLPDEFAEAARNLDATADDRFARIGLAPDVIALIRRRLAAWPRDPSQVPGASASRPQPEHRRAFRPVYIKAPAVSFRRRFLSSRERNNDPVGGAGSGVETATEPERGSAHNGTATGDSRAESRRVTAHGRSDVGITP